MPQLCPNRRDNLSRLQSGDIMQREATGLFFGVVVLAVATSAASAQSNPTTQNNPNSPIFGSRSEKSDGSVALTIGRRLPTEWDTRFGFDANMPAQPPSALVDAGLVDPTITRSTGAVWGSMTGPGVAPVIFDKTALDARIDPGQEKSQVAATLSRRFR